MKIEQKCSSIPSKEVMIHDLNNSLKLLHVMEFRVKKQPDQLLRPV